MITYTITGKAEIYGGKKHNFQAIFESQLSLAEVNNEYAIKCLTSSLKTALLPTLKKRNPDAEAFVCLEYKIKLDQEILDFGRIKNLN